MICDYASLMPLDQRRAFALAMNLAGLNVCLPNSRGDIIATNDSPFAHDCAVGVAVVGRFAPNHTMIGMCVIPGSEAVARIPLRRRPLIRGRWEQASVDGIAQIYALANALNVCGLRVGYSIGETGLIAIDVDHQPVCPCSSGTAMAIDYNEHGELGQLHTPARPGGQSAGCLYVERDSL